jgi:hypothetical protein
MSQSAVCKRGGFSPGKFRNSRWQEMQSGHIFEEILIGLKNAGFLGGIFVPLKRN